MNHQTKIHVTPRLVKQARRLARKLRNAAAVATPPAMMEIGLPFDVKHHGHIGLRKQTITITTSKSNVSGRVKTDIRPGDATCEWYPDSGRPLPLRTPPWFTPSKPVLENGIPITFRTGTPSNTVYQVGDLKMLRVVNRSPVSQQSPTVEIGVQPHADMPVLPQTVESPQKAEPTSPEPPISLLEGIDNLTRDVCPYLPPWTLASSPPPTPPPPPKISDQVNGLLHIPEARSQRRVTKSAWLALEMQQDPRDLAIQKLEEKVKLLEEEILVLKAARHNPQPTSATVLASEAVNAPDRLEHVLVPNRVVSPRSARRLRNATGQVDLGIYVPLASKNTNNEAHSRRKCSRSNSSRCRVSPYMAHTRASKATRGRLEEFAPGFVPYV